MYTLEFTLPLIIVYIKIRVCMATDVYVRLTSFFNDFDNTLNISFVENDRFSALVLIIVNDIASNELIETVTEDIFGEISNIE